MKLKILTLVFMALVLSSCSKEEEDYDFTGTWNLKTLTILNTLNGSNEYNLSESIQVDENCLNESALTVFPDNTALLKLTSNVVSTIYVVEGTTDELEQVLTCENEEELISLTWETGSYVEVHEDGTVGFFDSGDYNTIRFLDENGNVVLGGYVADNNNLGAGPADIFEDSVFVEIEGEEREFANSIYLVFNR